METLTYDRLSHQQRKVAYESWKETFGIERFKRLRSHTIETLNAITDDLSCDIHVDVDDDAILFLNVPLIETVINCIDMCAHGECYPTVNLPEVRANDDPFTTLAHNRWNAHCHEIYSVIAEALNKAKAIATDADQLTENEIQNMLEPSVEVVRETMLNAYDDTISTVARRMAKECVNSLSTETFIESVRRDNLRFASDGTVRYAVLDGGK